MPPAIATNLSDQQQHVWRGVLLRIILEAQQMFHISRSMDPAIGTFFQMKELMDGITVQEGLNRSSPKSAPSALPGRWKAAIRRHPVLSLNLWPAIVTVTGAITSGNYHLTSSPMFHGFCTALKEMREYGGYQTPGSNLELQLQCLQMYDPASPNPLPVIRHLRDKFSGVPVHEALALLPDTRTRRRSLQRLFARSLQLAQRQGLADVDWLSHTMDRLFASEPAMKLSYTGSYEQGTSVIHLPMSKENLISTHAESTTQLDRKRK
ncbi:hypothetical protein LTR86_010507 [Recurvomyces mirabilis]|nr:hypothetical protein LTR86_010507 [Recurvomyces mirabilis]